MKNIFNRICPFSRARADERFGSLDARVGEVQVTLRSLVRDFEALRRCVGGFDETLRRLLKMYEGAFADGAAAAADSRLAQETTHRFLRKLLAALDAHVRDRQSHDLVQDSSVNRIESLSSDIMRISERARRQGILAERTAAEAVWAHVFANVTDCSDWLTNRSFAPGRWAIGYAYLYVLYRVLNEVRPKCILDIGLGQSSKLIAQYAQTDPGIKHLIVESDQQWVEFCRRSFQLPANSKIILLDCERSRFGDIEGVRQFVGFADALSEFDKFDLVSIDAPYTGDMHELGRVDFLQLADSHLADSFVVMMDDVDRKSVAKAFDLLKSKVSDSGRPTAFGSYHSTKDFSVLASADLKFTTSL